MKLCEDEDLEFVDLLERKEKNALKTILDRLYKRGVYLYKPRLQIREVHDLIPYWIQKNWPAHEVTNTESKGLQNPGYPDYELTNTRTGEKLFIEVKVNMDGLRKTQINWFTKHQEKHECYVLYVKTPEEDIETK